MQPKPILYVQEAQLKQPPMAPRAPAVGTESDIIVLSHITRPSDLGTSVER